MKKILIIAASILFISACNKYEIKDQNKGQAIDFRVALETKATEITTADLTRFYVTAFKEEDGSIYFQDLLFTKNDESGYFESDEKYYWPADGKLHFYAYYPGSSDAGSSDALNISGTSKTITNYEAVGDITKQIDIIIAKATGSKTANQETGVELEFAHQLSQVEIKAVNNNAAYTYSIKGVKIANVNTVGSLDFSGESTVWESGTPGDYVIEYQDAKPILSDPVTLMSAEGNNAMLIPQDTEAWVVNPEEVTPEETPEGGDTPAEQAEEGDNIGSYISILVQINRVVDHQNQTLERVYPKGAEVDYAWMAVPVAFNWVAGYKYVITLDLGKGGGYEDPENDVTDGDVEKVLGGQMKFDVEVDSWNSKYYYENL